jgi:Zn-dependent peptidase ImmA (M78 family)
MAAAIPFRISPAVLEWARKSMGYSIDEAAKKSGVSSDKYKEWEKGLKQPTYRQLETLAERVFKRSLAVLFLPNPPAENSIQNDFRNLTNTEIEHLSPEVRISLRKAKRYQLILEEVLTERSHQYKEFSVSRTDNPLSAAEKFRNFLGLKLEEQKSWNYDSAYNNFKSKIESIGMFIFQFKMPLREARAFCLSDEIPIIVVSTEDTANGRIFSLFHEVCHIYFNVNGIFRDETSRGLTREYKEIEAFCNHFSAAFLVPDEDFLKEISDSISGSWDSSQISRLARKYNVSNEVIARKLLGKRLLSEGDFWSMKRLWDAQAKAFKEKEKQKLKEQETSGIAQDVKIVHEKGKPFVSSVLTAFQNGRISSADLSSYLETKLDHIPKIIQRLNS